MKKTLCLILALLMTGLWVPSRGETETVSFRGSVTVARDAAYVDLGDTRVNEWTELEAFLDQLPNLERVDMFASPVWKKQIEELTDRYPNVTFGWTIRIAEHTVRTDATAFSTLHNNRSAEHSSADFSVLKYCRDLLALDIGHNQVDDLSFLYDLPQLKVLIVACNHVTDITPIGSLKELEYLEVFKNRVTDLTPLAQLTHLVDLNICFNRVSDWSPLYGLTGLERLWLYNSNNYSDNSPVPAEAVRKLKEALPDTHIDSTSYSTLGGWRTHPRYDVIHQMFADGVYIPFDREEAAP